MGIFSDNEAGAGVGASGASVLPANTLKMNAMPGVVAGELLSLLENKRVATFKPFIGVTVEGNNTAPLSTAFAAANVLTGSATGVEYTNVCELSNGNIAIIGCKAATNQVVVTIRTPVGGQVLDEFNVQANSGGTNIYTAIAALPNEKFVVVWQTGTNPYKIKAAIYNNDGSLAVAAFDVYVSAGTTNMAVQVIGFSNGNFAVVYQEGSASSPTRYRIYDSTGAAVIAAQTLSAVTNDVARLKKLSNGNMLIFWRESSSYKFMVIDQVGTIVVSVQTLTTTGSQTGPRYVMISYFAVAELAGGNLVFMTPNNANQQPTIHIRTAAGAVVTSWSLSSTYYGDLMTPAIIPNDRGGFAIAGLMNSNFYYSTYTAAGVAEQATPVSIANMSVSPNYNGTGTYCQCAGIYIDGWGYLVIAIGYHDANNLTTMVVGLFRESISTVNSVAPEYRWAQIGSSIVEEASQTGYRLPVFLGKSSHRVVPWFYQASNGNAMKMVAYNTMRSSILGVAQNSYDAVQPISIETIGLFRLPASQEMGLSVAFDHRTNSVTGNKGTFVGRNLNLSGPTL